MLNAEEEYSSKFMRASEYKSVEDYGGGLILTFLLGPLAAADSTIRLKKIVNPSDLAWPTFIPRSHNFKSLKTHRSIMDLIISSLLLPLRTQRFADRI